MKILIITENVGRTAPGIVFERLIDGLSKFHAIDIVTSDLDASLELVKINNIIEIKRIKIPSRLQKMLITAFAINPMDLFWSNRVISSLKKNGSDKYDLIFSLISFNHYAPIITGNKISNKLKVKHFVYLVDAIPAPIGWLKDDLFFKNTKKLIAKYLGKVDGLFSANEKMLNYQLKTFISKKNIITEIIYNPSKSKLQIYEYKNDNKYTFLYTGGMYGPRKSEYILNGFSKILREYPNSTLEFVGGNIPEHAMLNLREEDRIKIIIHPFTKDLTPFYERATALIDIDADLPNDVFLSSKITNYITINRIIISETGENSPSRHLFKGIPSIIQCGHEANAIANAMRQAINQNNSIDFNDRANVISLFSVDSVVEKINNKISL